MKASSSEPQEPDVLRVFQSKSETKAFYNKISPVYSYGEVTA